MIGYQLGDMTVLGKPPAKLVKALAVIAATMHQEFERCPRFRPGASRDGCVLSALTVRDFLRRIGFQDASVRPVFVLLAAFRGDTILHSLGIGSPEDDRKVNGRWTGHLVACVEGYLIDCTLYPAANRPAWEKHLTGMLAAPIGIGEAAEYCGLKLLAAYQGSDDEDPDYSLDIAYFDNPTNTTWQRGPDAVDRLRRRPIISAMRARFGNWRE